MWRCRVVKSRCGNGAPAFVDAKIRRGCKYLNFALTFLTFLHVFADNRCLKSRSCFHKSGSCFDKSWSCFKKSRTCEENFTQCSAWQAKRKIRLKKVKSILRMHFSRARIYGFYFPKKAFTPSHNVRFLLIFIGFWCEGFVFQAFTLAVNVTFPDFG